MKTVMILMMAILVQANTKAADTNVVGLMMASKLSPANHPALAGTAGTTATVATAAINEASKIKRQSETINFIQPEVEPEKKPESLEKPKPNLGRPGQLGLLRVGSFQGDLLGAHPENSE